MSIVLPFGTREEIFGWAQRVSAVPSLGIGLGNGLLVEFMKDRFKNPQLEHLPESGHDIAEEAPEQVAKYVVDFLRSVDNN